MAAGQVSLNQGPPLPPNLQPPPSANMGQLAGGDQASSTGNAALLDSVMKKLMFVQQTLNEIGEMLPEAAPIAQGFIDSIRKAMGQILAKGATPPPAPGAGGGLMAGPQTMSNPTAGG